MQTTVKPPTKWSAGVRLSAFIVADIIIFGGVVDLRAGRIVAHGGLLLVVGGETRGFLSVYRFIGFNKISHENISGKRAPYLLHQG